MPTVTIPTPTVLRISASGVYLRPLMGNHSIGHTVHRAVRTEASRDCVVGCERDPEIVSPAVKSGDVMIHKIQIPRVVVLHLPPSRA